MGHVNMSIVEAAVGNSVTVDDCKATLVISQPAQIHFFSTSSRLIEGEPGLTSIIRAYYCFSRPSCMTRQVT